MATAHQSCIEQIGDTAGLVWHYLNANGPASMTQLAKDIDAPRDVIMQAVGWLAREDKLSIDESRNKKIVVLRG
jgi:hypothetical protein